MERDANRRRRRVVAERTDRDAGNNGSGSGYSVGLEGGCNVDRGDKEADEEERRDVDTVVTSDHSVLIST